MSLLAYTLLSPTSQNNFNQRYCSTSGSMSDIEITCPNCEEKIMIDFFSCQQGTQIFCPNCKKLITLNFQGKTPNDILDEIKNSFNNINIKIKFR